jgi:hypothetical protein
LTLAPVDPRIAAKEEALSRERRMGQPVHTRVLRSACELVGGIDKLSVHLDVPLHSLAAWVDGRGQPPRRVFLNALDLIIERDPALRGAANTRMVHLLRQSVEALASPAAAAEEFPQYDKLLFWEPEFLARGSRRAVLESAVDAALQLTGADAGSVQLLEPGRRILRMTAQRGFDQPFLDYFAVVHDGSRCASAEAVVREGRVMVHDVAASEIYRESPSMEVLLHARCRAVQCTPLIGASGRLLGMISTNYGRPHTPSAADERVLDRIAARAAGWLERQSAP